MRTVNIRNRSGVDLRKGRGAIAAKYVYLFAEGNAKMKDLLGGKGQTWPR